MKKTIIALLLLISSAFAQIEWEDYEDALKLAKEDNKIVLIMFSSPTCKVCKYMKNKVYTDSSVAEYMNEHFVCVEIDTNDNPDSKKFKTLGTPNYFFLKATGELIVPRMVGGAKASDFLKKLKNVRKHLK